MTGVALALLRIVGSPDVDVVMTGLEGATLVS